MQDDPPYYSPSAFVYAGEHAFTLEELWSGVDRIERRGPRARRRRDRPRRGRRTRAGT